MLVERKAALTAAAMAGRKELLSAATTAVRSVALRVATWGHTKAGHWVALKGRHLAALSGSRWAARTVAWKEPMTVDSKAVCWVGKMAGRKGTCLAVMKADLRAVTTVARMAVSMADLTAGKTEVKWAVRWAA